MIFTAIGLEETYEKSMRGISWTFLPGHCERQVTGRSGSRKKKGGSRACCPLNSALSHQKNLICAEYCLVLPVASLMMKLTFVSTPGLGVIR